MGWGCEAGEVLPFVQGFDQLGLRETLEDGGRARKQSADVACGVPIRGRENAKSFYSVRSVYI